MGLVLLKNLTLAFVSAVALCALIYVGLVHIYPTIVVEMNRDALQSNAIACHEAQSMSESLSDWKREVGEEKHRALKRSSSVAMLSCVQLRLLETKLMTEGVDPKVLHLMFRRAVSKSRVSMRYVLRYGKRVD